MAGLEKIVIFDDYFVVIFDAPKHDKSDWAILDFYVDAKRQTVYAVYEGTYAKSDTDDGRMIMDKL